MLPNDAAKQIKEILDATDDPGAALALAAQEYGFVIVTSEAAVLINGARAARETLRSGLKYHEHDMPKRVARDALEELGLPRDRQPGLSKDG